jgi:hypothetical protein
MRKWYSDAFKNNKAAPKEDPLNIGSKGNMIIEFPEVWGMMLIFGGPKTYESKR